MGLRFHGEQGAEALHDKFNQLRQYSCISDPLQQLKLILQEHHLQLIAHKDLLEPPTEITKV